MQREIPTPVAIAVILVVLLVVGILFVRAWTGRRQMGQEALQIQEIQKFKAKELERMKALWGGQVGKTP